MPSLDLHLLERENCCEIVAFIVFCFPILGVTQLPGLKRISFRVRFMVYKKVDNLREYYFLFLNFYYLTAICA